MSLDDVLDTTADELNRLDPPVSANGRGHGNTSGTRSTPPPPTVDPDSTGEEVLTWDRIDLAQVIAGNYVQPMPDLLTRDDGRSLWYPGQVNGLHGDSGVGKGWVTGYATAQAIRAGLKVMFIDLEDVPTSIVARLRLLGLTDTQIALGLDYRRPQVGFAYQTVQRLAAELTDGGHELVVVDSLGEAFALDGIDENKDADVGPWLRRVARPLAETGAAVVLVDHSTKAADNPLHPSGSKRKRAAIGGASYLVEATRPLKKGQGGRLKLSCAKDRHGNYARNEHVADLVMANDPHRGVTFALYAPDVRPEGEGSTGLEVAVIAAKFVQLVKASQLPVNKTMAREMVKVKARSDAKRAALDYAIASGALIEEPGKGTSKNLVYVHDIEAP